jgi:hypothetical protein
MNIYRAISEQLTVTIPILDDGSGPEEPYCIAHLVAAENPAQAKWDAWKSDRDSFEGDPREMPKFRIHLRRKGVDVPRGIVSDDPRFQDCWEDETE